jgi:hypothetical protein
VLVTSLGFHTGAYTVLSGMAKARGMSTKPFQTQGLSAPSNCPFVLLMPMVAMVATCICKLVRTDTAY